MSGKIEAGWRDRVDLHKVNLHEVPRGKIDRHPARVLTQFVPTKEITHDQEAGGWGYSNVTIP